ncbi:MAG: hypothetical protein E7226_00975 [Clostridiales bacterium]|nr:hypothetical protein [Clostridiales bacterium]
MKSVNKTLLFLLVMISMFLLIPTIACASENNSTSDTSAIASNGTSNPDAVDAVTEDTSDDSSPNVEAKSVEAESDYTLKEPKEDCNHSWTKYVDHKRAKVNDTYHAEIEYCLRCKGERFEDESNWAKHDRGHYSDDTYTSLDANHHQLNTYCFRCKSRYNVVEEHNWCTSGERYNNIYHRLRSDCIYCDEEKYGGLEKHSWSGNWVYCKQKATITKNGLLACDCSNCNHEMTRAFKWKRNGANCASYNIMNRTNIYRNSKSVTVWLANPAKGAVIHVKIGKKTYKVKIKNNSKKVKVKIKKPKKYAQKINTKLYYKGKLIGVADEFCVDDVETFDRVLYGKKIKKGMSKKQVRYLYDWGDPRDTATASGGYTYWYYWGSSYVVFKNGKVKRWYKS